MIRNAPGTDRWSFASPRYSGDTPSAGYCVWPANATDVTFFPFHVSSPGIQVPPSTLWCLDRLQYITIETYIPEGVWTQLAKAPQLETLVVGSWAPLGFLRGLAQDEPEDRSIPFPALKNVVFDNIGESDEIPHDPEFASMGVNWMRTIDIIFLRMVVPSTEKRREVLGGKAFEYWEVRHPFSDESDEDPEVKEQLCRMLTERGIAARVEWMG